MLTSALCVNSISQINLTKPLIYMVILPRVILMYKKASESFEY